MAYKVKPTPKYWREPVRFPWRERGWWLQKLAELPDKSCPRGHGTATAYHLPLFTGQTLGYKCLLCGWDETVLVQEGTMDPAPPSRSEPPRPSKLDPRIPGKPTLRPYQGKQ